MKTINTKAKHTEWLSAEDMHASSKIWLSELAFFKDEQLFLEDLIKSHTLQLIDKSHFDRSKDVIDRLSQVVKQTEVLFNAVTKHENELSIMVDGIDELAKEANYKKEHRNLIELIGEFKKRYQKIKAELFALVKEVIKEAKENRLIDKQ
jgi:transcriptional regulator of heat shock response